MTDQKTRLPQIKNDFTVASNFFAVPGAVAESDQDVAATIGRRSTRHDLPSGTAPRTRNCWKNCYFAAD
jgi:hypothetical protein